MASQQYLSSFGENWKMCCAITATHVHVYVLKPNQATPPNVRKTDPDVQPSSDHFRIQHIDPKGGDFCKDSLIAALPSAKNILRKS